MFYYVRRIQDVDTQVNTTDAPFRFLPCVIAGLSYYLAVKKAPDRIQLLKSIYEEEFQKPLTKMMIDTFKTYTQH